MEHAEQQVQAILHLRVIFVPQEVEQVLLLTLLHGRGAVMDSMEERLRVVRCQRL